MTGRDAEQPDLSRIADEAAIARIASEIDRAVDDKDWPLMRRHFAEEVAVDVGAVTGGTVIEMSGDAFVAEVAMLNGPGKTSFHSHTNTLIAIDGDTATFTCHSYGWAQHPSFAPPLYEVWGTLDYQLRRATGGWLVTGVRMVKTREAGNSAVSEYRPASEEEETVAIETPVEEGDANAQPV